MSTLADKLPKSLDTKSINLDKINRILPPTLTILLIIACAYTLSQITWALIPGDDSQMSSPSIGVKDARNKQQEKSYHHISDSHLFGQYQQSTAPTIKTDAPDTRLNLTLKGVLAATPMKNAAAIISLGKNGKEDVYSIGDKVSSASVVEIHADRVILQRSGKMETLRLPKDNNSNFIKSSTNKNRSRASRPATPGAVLSDIRKQILKNPTSFGKFAIPVPYNENGKLRGYRLQPQGDSTLFDAVGLSPNDVLIAINGVELNNPAKGLKALRSLQKAKQVNLTVLRNGVEMPLHFEIP